MKSLSLLFSLVIIIFNSCSSISGVDKLDELYYKNENLEASYGFSKKYNDTDFLWAFQSGILGFQSGDFDDSLDFLNLSEFYFEQSNQTNVFENGFKTLASILLSNGLFDYYGNLYESVLINYYKAINYIMVRNDALARIEFNRANDRQRRSKDFFEDRINKINKTLNNGNVDYDRTITGVDNGKTYNSMLSIYNTKYKNLSNFRVYDGYINPVVSYVSGIFFMIQNDFTKSSDLLKEAYGVSNSIEVLRDIELLENRRKFTDNNFYTWVFIEDGRIPKKIEMRLDVPLFLIKYGVFSFNTAFPSLDSGSAFFDKYYICTGSSTLDSGFEIANMSSLVVNEFNIELPYIIMTSLISSTYKLYLQISLNDNFGPIGGIGGMIFSTISTNADTRSARILPLRFVVMRIKNKEGIFNVVGNGKTLYSFTIDEKCSQLCLHKDNIIYMRSLQNGIISSSSRSF